MAAKQRYSIKITGRVQGVGFRYTTLSEARRIGLTGFVRNMPDGSVYIEAEGPVETLNSFVAWCRKGPGISFVDSLTANPIPPTGDTGFNIK